MHFQGKIFKLPPSRKNLIIIYYSFRSIKQQYHVGKIYLINIDCEFRKAKGRAERNAVSECEMRGEWEKTNKTNANTNNMFYINMKLS